jgi:hypothetical protein
MGHPAFVAGMTVLRIAVKYFARGPVTLVSSMGHLMDKEIDNG